MKVVMFKAKKKNRKKICIYDDRKNVVFVVELLTKLFQDCDIDAKSTLYSKIFRRVIKFKIEHYVCTTTP